MSAFGQVVQTPAAATSHTILRLRRHPVQTYHIPWRDQHWPSLGADLTPADRRAQRRSRPRSAAGGGPPVWRRCGPLSSNGRSICTSAAAKKRRREHSFIAYVPSTKQIELGARPLTLLRNPKSGRGPHHYNEHVHGHFAWRASELLDNPCRLPVL